MKGLAAKRIDIRTGLGLASLFMLVLATPAHGDRTVFVSNSGSLGGTESITSFSVRPDGSLAALPIHPVGERPEGVAVTPDARFLYAATVQAAGVRGYAIGQDGSLKEVPGSPFATGGINTSGIAITPSGGRVLVTNRGTALNNAADPGSVAVYDVNRTSGLLTPVGGSPFGVTGLEDPEGIAIAPSGDRAFVTGDAAGATFDGRLAVLGIDQATGAVSEVAGSPFDFDGVQPVPIVISPNGNRLFVGNVHGTLGNSISVLDVDRATGAVSPVTGSPFATVGPTPIALALSADGARLFSGERAPPLGSSGVSVYDIAADGKLTSAKGSPFASGGEVRGVATPPDGRAAYAAVSSDPGVVAGYSVGAAGALTPLAGSPYPTGDKFVGTFVIAMTPSQTPRPAFTANAGQPGRATTFDASTTTVPGGRATRFDWTFGDGNALSNGGPTPAHTYSSPGTYSVSLTVTNDCEGLDLVADTVFTGQTAHCKGSPRAATTRKVVVPDSIAPVVSKLKIAKRFAPSSKPTATTAASSKVRKVRRGAKIRFSLSEAAGVRIVVKKKSRGAKPTKGTLIRTGKQGPNSVPFSGRIGKRPLKQGSYFIVVTATDNAGNRSQPMQAPFSIVAAKK